MLKCKESKDCQSQDSGTGCKVRRHASARTPNHRQDFYSCATDKQDGNAGAGAEPAQAGATDEEAAIANAGALPTTQGQGFQAGFRDTPE